MSSRSSQPFLLKVNTTCSCVTGNAAQSHTIADSRLQGLPGANRTTVWAHTHTPTKWEHTGTHISARTYVHACADTAMSSFWPASRDNLVCVYSHFTHLLSSSCATLLSSLSFTVSPFHAAEWLPFPLSCCWCHHLCALVLSTTSHPGYETTGSLAGVSYMEKICPSLPVTHSHAFHDSQRDTALDKGCQEQAQGRITQKVLEDNNSILRKWRLYLLWDVRTSEFDTDIGHGLEWHRQFITEMWYNAD